MLKELFEKIDREIKRREYYKPYKERQRFMLEIIFKENGNFDFYKAEHMSFYSFVIARMVVNEKYATTDELQDVLNEAKFFESIEIPEVVIPYLDENFLKNKIHILKLVEFIHNDYTAKEMVRDVLGNGAMKKCGKIDRQIRGAVFADYVGFDDVQKIVDEITDYYNKCEEENKERELEHKKEVRKLYKLKTFLLSEDKKNEIRDIDNIMALVPMELEADVLNYIAYKNNNYQQKLQEEVIAKKQSINLYASLLNEFNIDFQTLDDDDKRKITEFNPEDFKNIIRFLAKLCLTKEEVLKIVLVTNISVIDNLNQYIEKGILKNSIISNNPEIFNPKINALVDLNIKTLSDMSINLLHTSFKSPEVYFFDNELIKQNLAIALENSINISTRHLMDYSFLNDLNFEDKVAGLKDLGIDINENIEVINADINIIKRIKLCQSLNIDIYVNGKIRSEVLNAFDFFIKDDMIDDYLNIDINAKDTKR